MTKRIIPISSGKGGVGKTSFAINLALCLSQFGKTVLVDLDTGTSSIRNVIGAPIRRDLYHFFKKNDRLDDCITPLPVILDPDKKFDNFGFVASPLHMINSIANMSQEDRNRLIDAINGIHADYVILDLRAGLDPMVTDFLPHSNTGILVFTPNHPAATLSASDIVKAALFRKLREVFHVGSPVYSMFKPGTVKSDRINEMIDIAEDVYEPEIANLDHFLSILERETEGHPIVKMLVDMVEYFRVYYVLNRFDGVDSSFDTAIKPFVENIANNISPRPNISNLGWIIESKKYHQSNIDLVPYILQYQGNQAAKAAKKSAHKSKKKIDRDLEELYKLSGLRKEKPAKRQKRNQKRKETEDALQSQLNAIEAMYKSKKKENEYENFQYIISCVRYLFQSKRIADFGDTRIFKKGELVPLLLRRRLSTIHTL
ncbi:AAA family ATPase [Sulfidibacter corallicola]|uniref:AAA family ATPase n=1 Tax=Sulfidibacter corallicola TaxID=2818388 RepID=A0A8A4TSR8_SULCO|nr:AAA family ATPase [Sulfidibacter corallicola]QTD52996.1 AAA family ATPase [Sulfidibacter corallicola]